MHGGAGRSMIHGFLSPTSLSLVFLALAMATPDPCARADEAPENAGCDLSEPERRMETLLRGDGQKRPALRCRHELQAFARQRARDMAKRRYLSHVTPERRGPNQLLRDRGYPLPPSYQGGLSNNVESIVGGIRAPADVWRALTLSATHRGHILGEDPDFLDQDEFGVAYYRDIYAPHVDYWVIVIARRGRPDEPAVLCTPQPAECFKVPGRDSGPLQGTPTRP
jgi:hypothetical protein